MQARHVESSLVRGDQLTDDLFQVERAGVDDPRVRRAVRQQIVGHDRAGVQADLARPQQPLPAHRDEIGGAGTRADEVHRHSLTTVHWVIGNAGRQPVKPPIGSP